MRRRLLVRPVATLTVVLAIAACRDDAAPTAPGADLPRPDLAVVDASTGGNAGVLFLPPLRPQGRTGAFDPTVPLDVEIRLRGSAEVAGFAVADGSIAVRGNHYALDWRVPGDAAPGDVFEIRAFALTLELGRLDVEIAGSGRDMVRIRQAGDNAATRDVGRNVPVRLWIGVDGVALAEEEAEQACAAGEGVLDCDVEVANNQEGGDVSVVAEDPVTGGPVLAGRLTVDPGDVVDGEGNPVAHYVLTLLHLPPSTAPAPSVPAAQQFPFVLRATLTDGDGNPLAFATGASLVLCQPSDLETNQAAPYFLPAPQAQEQRILKVDGGVATALPTVYGAPECEGAGAPEPSGLGQALSLDGLASLARRGLRRVAALLVAEPLRAGHGGLTTIKSIRDLSDFAGALLTDPAASTAAVPDGVAGVATVVSVQARVTPSVAQTRGGDAVTVAVTGANSATLTVGAGVVDNGDGTYTAIYTPAAAGIDQVAVTLDDPLTGTPVAVAGSPFTSTVSGVVDVEVASQGAPLPGASVVLGGAAAAAATSDAAGRASFGGLMPGAYTVTVALAGYDGTVDPVAVGSPGRLAVATDLAPCPAPAADVVATIEAQSPEVAEGRTSTLQIRCSTEVEFVNFTSETVDVFWIDFTGARVPYSTLAPGERYRQQTWPEHPWIVVGRESGDLAFFEPLPADQAPAAAIVGTPGPAVSGTVAYSGTPLAGVRVEVAPWTGSATGPTLLTTLTDAAGAYVFPAVPPGDWHVRAFGPDPDFIGWVGFLPTVEETDVLLDFQLPRLARALSPAQGATVVGAPTLAWAAYPLEAERWSVQVNVTATWELVTLEKTTAPAFTFEGALEPGGTYTWQVDGFDAAGRRVAATEQASTFTVEDCPGSVAVTPESRTVVGAGHAVAFAAAAQDCEGSAPGAEFGWSSSNPAVAAVDASGVVTAVAPGTAVIRASTECCGSGEATFTVVAGAPDAWPNLPAGLARRESADESTTALWTSNRDWGEAEAREELSAPSGDGRVVELRMLDGMPDGDEPEVWEKDVSADEPTEFYAAYVLRIESPFQFPEQGAKWGTFPFEGPELFPPNNTLGTNFFAQLVNTGSTPREGPFRLQASFQGLDGEGNDVTNLVNNAAEPVDFVTDTWYRVEWHVVMDDRDPEDASAAGSAVNGSIRAWVSAWNGTGWGPAKLQLDYDGLTFNREYDGDAGGVTPPFFHTLKLDWTWGGGAGTLTQDNVLLFDHILMAW